MILPAGLVIRCSGENVPESPDSKPEDTDDSSAEDESESDLSLADEESEAERNA